MSDTDAETRKFVVGLGNPGREYAGTRHNVGFRVLEALRRRWAAPRGRKAFGGRLDDVRVERPGEPARAVMLLEPHTYMNCAGSAVRDLVTFHRGQADDVLVVLDDMALPLGRLRMRTDGSAGGHNGLSDVLSALGTASVARLRIGIGAAPSAMDGRDYVLSRFRDDETETIRAAIETAADAAEDWVFRGANYVMDRYNRKPESAGSNEPE